MTNHCKAPFCENLRYQKRSYCYVHIIERAKYNVKNYIELLPLWAVKRCKRHGLLTLQQCRSLDNNVYRCIICSRAIKNKSYCPKKARKYRMESADIIKHRHYQRKFNIPVQEQLSLLKKQKNLCAICKNPQQDFKGLQKNRPLYLDHCHETGKARQFLCASCNSGLGFFKDDIKLMRVAIKYLLRHKVNKL